MWGSSMVVSGSVDSNSSMDARFWSSTSRNMFWTCACADLANVGSSGGNLSGGVARTRGGAAGRRSKWANCARSRNSFFSRLSRSCLMRATMADASRFPSGPITGFGLGGRSGLWESIVVAMVSSSGSFERLDRAGEGPRGSAPRSGLLLFWFFRRGRLCLVVDLRRLLEEPGEEAGLRWAGDLFDDDAGRRGVPGERGMLVVGCLSRGCLAASRLGRRRDVQYVLAPRLPP